MGRCLCLIVVLGLLVVGIPPVKAETKYLVPELRYEDGSPVYANPEPVWSGVNSTGSDENDRFTKDESSPPQALTADIWWKQFHSNFYKDGYAPTTMKRGDSVNLWKVSIGYSHGGYGKKVSASPVVVSEMAIIHNYDTMEGYYYNYDNSYQGSPLWYTSNQRTKHSIVSDGTYYWNIHKPAPMPEQSCLDKYYVNTGLIATSGPCWSTSTIDHFADLTYSPAHIQPYHKATIYVLVDFVGGGNVAKLYAYEAQTLSPRWNTQLYGKVGYSSPVVEQRNNEPRQIILGDLAGYIYSIREDTGAIITYYSAGTSIVYSPTIDRYTWGYVYVVASNGKLYKFDLTNFYGMTKSWERQLEGYSGSFAAPVNTGNWVFVKSEKYDSLYGDINIITMVKKNNQVVKRSDEYSPARSNNDHNSGNIIIPSIAVGNNYVFSPIVRKSASYYYPSIQSFGYDSTNGGFSSITIVSCDNGPASTSPIFAQDSSPAIIYRDDPNVGWLLYYTYYWNNGAGYPGMCKMPLIS